MGIQSNFWLDSRMNSEVRNDTAPDSGGGVSAFETMVTEYREDQEKTGANKSNFWPWHIFTVTTTWAYKRDHSHQHHQYYDDHNDNHNIIRMSSW